MQDKSGTTLTLLSRHVVLALSAAGAGRLLQPMLPQAGDILGSIESASMVVLNLGFRREDIGHPLDGFGFLVPHDEPNFPLMGVLWADSVFPHHAPEGQRLLRVFIGGSRDPTAAARSDNELLNTAMDGLRGLLHVTGEPSVIEVCRHKAAIPQYHQGHTEKIARVRACVERVPGMHLVGNYLEGVSLNDCVRLAVRVAGEVSRGCRDPADDGATPSATTDVEHAVA